MSNVYVIGDIHGHLDKLKAVHDLIADDQVRNGAGTIVHVGDLVDRGPDAKGVLQYLIDGQSAGENWVVLKGNHDRMMQWFLEAEPKRDPRLRAGLDWLHPRLGGMTTLKSYGVAGEDLPAAVHNAARNAVPSLHTDFLAGLPLAYQTEEALIVHAGVRPGVRFEDQSEDDLLWIREDFHASSADHGKLIVHGHTPVDEVTHYGNRVNIDTGAGHGLALSVIILEGRDVFHLTSNGRTTLSPV